MKNLKDKRSVSISLVLSLVLALIPTFVFAGEDGVRPDTIMGTSTLYDYSESASAGAEYFLFGRANGNFGDYNSWSRAEDYRIRQGLVKDTLDENGNVQLSSVNIKGKDVQLTVPDLNAASEGKLFMDGEKTGTYKMPFLYNEQNGRYEFDSKKNNLAANNETKVLEYTKPNSIGFMPMGEENYLFGAVTTLPFVYANGGKANGEDMVFEFSGDDDVWVFIDGHLVLDLGGIHNAVSGRINFATQEVETVGKIKNSDANDTVTRTKLPSSFDASVKDHEIKIFYLERGKGFSNCKMSFNLVQPTNYVVKYYDGKYYNGKNGNEGLIATVVQNAREDGTKLYAGDEIRQKEIKINVNDKTAELSNRSDYYGGFTVDKNFIKVTDAESVVTTVTEDDSDVVYVIFFPKPSYTVTYWTTSNADDLSDQSQWAQVTQKMYNGTVGQQVKVSDIDTAVKFEDGFYAKGSVVTPDVDGVLGILSDEKPFNVDVVCSKVTEEEFEQETNPGKPEKEVPPYQPPYSLKSDMAYIFGRSDTKMEAEDNILRGEASATLYRLLKQNQKLGGFSYDASSEPLFSDTKGRWDRSALEYMAYIGMYATDRAFVGPNAPITRGEAFKMFCIALGFTGETGYTKEQYSSILEDAGFVEGYEDGSLRLDNSITRAEFCKIYNLIIGRDKNHLETYFGKKILPETYGFTDLKADAWYYEIMLKATSAFDGNGYAVIEDRGVRNELDDYQA